MPYLLASGRKPAPFRAAPSKSARCRRTSGGGVVTLTYEPELQTVRARRRAGEGLS
jgi:hypothetical protein